MVTDRCVVQLTSPSHDACPAVPRDTIIYQRTLDLISRLSFAVQYEIMYARAPLYRGKIDI